MDVRYAYTSGKPGNLGIVPLNGEGEWSASKDTEVIRVMGVLPDVFTGEHQVAPQGLLQAYVELIPPAWTEGSRRVGQTDQQWIQNRIRASPAGEHQILIEWSFQNSRIRGPKDRVRPL